MKKILIILIALLIGGFAFADEDGFSWSEYEMLCFQYGVEPSYEQYEDLCQNPQCILVGMEDDIEIDG